MGADRNIASFDSLFEDNTLFSESLIGDMTLLYMYNCSSCVFASICVNCERLDYLNSVVYKKLTKYNK